MAFVRCEAVIVSRRTGLEISRLDEIAHRIVSAWNEAYDGAQKVKHTDVPLIHTVQEIELPRRKVLELEWRWSRHLPSVCSCGSGRRLQCDSREQRRTKLVPKAVTSNSQMAQRVLPTIGS